MYQIIGMIVAFVLLAGFLWAESLIDRDYGDAEEFRQYLKKQEVEKSKREGYNPYYPE